MSDANTPGQPIAAKAEVSQSVVSLALAIGQINVFSPFGAKPDPYACAPTLAHAQIDWLLSDGGFTPRELAPALKREILQWDEPTAQLVCVMGWVRWLVAGLVLTFALGFALAGWAVIVLGEHSYTWAAVTLMCGVFSVAALHWLQVFVFGPRRVALRVVRKLRAEGL